MAWYLPTRCPVFFEELRRRLRGGRGFLMLFIYGAVLLALLLGVNWLKQDQLGNTPAEWPEFGRLLWIIFLYAQLIAVVLLSPGITASAISAERESGTLESLFLTPITTLSFIVGKFLGAVGQMLLIILSGVPIISAVFVFGGVAPREVLAGYALILGTGLLYAALGFLASCLIARTTFAVVWAYGFMLTLLLVLPAGLVIFAAFSPGIMLGDTSVLYSAAPFLLDLQTLAERETQRQVWHTLGTMLLWTALILGGCTLKVRSLRGVHSLLPRRVSLDVARHNSRPPAAKG